MTRFNYNMSWLVGFVFVMFIAASSGADAGAVAYWGGVILGLVMLVLTFFRLRNAGHSAWWGVIGFIPWVNLILYIGCMFMPTMERSDDS